MGKIDLALYVKKSDNLDDPILNKQLIDLFPFMRPRDDWSGKDLTTDPNFDWTWTLINEIPNGWRKAFGWDLVCEIAATLSEEEKEKYYPVQIKEKFGELRWYSNLYDDRIDKIVNKYSLMSAKICIKCGKPAKFISKGWICPWCEDCAGQNHNNCVPIEKWFSE